MVYCTADAAPAYVEQGGIAATLDRMQIPNAFVVNESKVARRIELLHRPSANSEDYCDLNIRWFVVEPDDVVMKFNAERWEREGAVRRVADFGSIAVFRCGG
jgi:hypothetical protein